MFNPNQAPGEAFSKKDLSPLQLAKLLETIKDTDERREFLSKLTDEEKEALAVTPLSPNEEASAPRKTKEDIEEIRKLNS